MERALSGLVGQCVAIDERRSLVASADFIQRGQGRNIEVGALIDDPALAKNVVHQWSRTVNAGLFVLAPVGDEVT